MKFTVEINLEFGETVAEMRALIEEALRDNGYYAVVYTEDYVE